MVEASIRLIEVVAQQGRIKGIQIARSAPSITNLCFADDTMIFFHATPEYAENMKHILEVYARVSGQVINLEKSSMLFSSRISTEKEQIKNIMGVQVVDKLDKYLGMPSVVGKSK